jgi:hypothetical protein
VIVHQNILVYNTSQYLDKKDLILFIDCLILIIEYRMVKPNRLAILNSLINFAEGYPNYFQEISYFVNLKYMKEHIRRIISLFRNDFNLKSFRQTIYHILIIAILISCHSNKSDENSILDYILLKNRQDTTYREFQFKKDSTISRIFIRQKAHKINDTIWQLEYNWRRSDSIPINKSIERYASNYIQFVSQSFYESSVDSESKVSEVKAEILGKNSFLLNELPGSIDLKYKFQSDPYLIAKVHSDFFHEFKSIDSLDYIGSDWLIVTSKDKMSLEYSDSRKDTTFISTFIRVYAKDRGLMFFMEQHANEKYLYRLKSD